MRVGGRCLLTEDVWKMVHSQDSYRVTTLPSSYMTGQPRSTMRMRRGKAESRFTNDFDVSCSKICSRQGKDGPARMSNWVSTTCLYGNHSSGLILSRTRLSAVCWKALSGDISGAPRWYTSSSRLGHRDRMRCIWLDEYVICGTNVNSRTRSCHPTAAINESIVLGIVVCRMRLVRFVTAGAFLSLSSLTCREW